MICKIHKIRKIYKICKIHKIRKIYKICKIMRFMRFVGFIRFIEFMICTWFINFDKSLYHKFHQIMKLDKFLYYDIWLFSILWYLTLDNTFNLIIILKHDNLQYLKNMFAKCLQWIIKYYIFYKLWYLAIR